MGEFFDCSRHWSTVLCLELHLFGEDVEQNISLIVSMK